jgi:gas vesicle protein
MIMKEESTHRKSSILIPVLMGSAVGAGVALLLAPKSGKEVRKDLKRFAAKTRDQVAEVIDEGRDLYEEGREVVAKAVKAGKETYEEGTEKIEKLMHGKKRSLMVPILASGVIGAGIALMLAPKTGKEVRRDLKRIAANTRDKVVSAIDKGKVLYMEGRKAIPEAVKAGKKVYIHEKEKLRHAA